jgi:hypothetical protein
MARILLTATVGIGPAAIGKVMALTVQTRLFNA